MKLTGKWIATSALIIGLAGLAGCSPSATEPKAASNDAPADQSLELIEIIARPAGESATGVARPAHPADAVELAIRTKGTTKGADLAVKMIALADGSTVATDKLRLNAGNAAAPRFQFEPRGTWPTGRYLFEVMLDGKLAGSQELEVFPADDVAPSP